MLNERGPSQSRAPGHRPDRFRGTGATVGAPPASNETRWDVQNGRWDHAESGNQDLRVRAGRDHADDGNWGDRCGGHFKGTHPGTDQPLRKGSHRALEVDPGQSGRLQGSRIVHQLEVPFRRVHARGEDRTGELCASTGPQARPAWERLYRRPTECGLRSFGNQCHRCPSDNKAAEHNFSPSHNYDYDRSTVNHHHDARWSAHHSISCRESLSRRRVLPASRLGLHDSGKRRSDHLRAEQRAPLGSWMRTA